MPWDRKQRQEAILREKIAVIVIERLSDPRLGFITITSVELSKDKKVAKVFYTVLGTDAQIRSTSRALADGRGRVQEMLAPTLNMRSMPELRFIFNELVQKESKLLDLIGEVTAERVERAGPDEEEQEGGLVFGEPLDPDEGGLEFETPDVPDSGSGSAADVSDDVTVDGSGEDPGEPDDRADSLPDESPRPRDDPAP